MVIMDKLQSIIVILVLMSLIAVNPGGGMLPQDVVASNGDICEQCISVETQAQLEFPIMKVSTEKMREWSEHHEALPKVEAPMLAQFSAFQMVGAGEGSKSILNHLEYTPSERNQGSCGNCWQWAGLGVIAIALDVQAEIKDRLSVQYLNSCVSSEIGVSCCAGGWLDDVENFVDSTGRVIPWSNTNASWQDGGASCGTSCGSISTTPYYPVTAITELAINTHGVGEATAISNIKSVLDQDKAVWLAFYLPNDSDWNSFRSFWANDAEEDIWDPSSTYGHTWIGGESGGHAVLIVGYNDEAGTDNDYWVALNSWGTRAGRPNGLYRIDMHLDYDYSYPGQGYYSMYWETLNLTFTATPEVAFSSATYTVDEDGGNASVTVGLSESAPYPVTVNYATSDGTALAGSDYTATSGTLTFASGDVIESFTVPVTNDSSFEDDETITLTLSNPVNASLGSPSSATLTISDNDSNQVAFSSASYTVAENVSSGTATVTVVLSGTSSQTITVNYATSDGTASEGTDYTSASGTLTFAAGNVSETFAVSINDDSVAEANETVTLALSNPVNVVLGGTSSATLTITDNDTPEVTFSSATYSIAENVASGTATITTVLSGTSTQSITVNYSTSNGTALTGSDYTAASGTLTFAAGESSQTFSVNITNDSTIEADETVNLTLSNPVNATLGGTSSATLTISSEDVPSVRFSAAIYSINENVASGTATISAVLSGTSPQTITVNYATSNGTALAGSDYTSASGTLTFAAGVSSKTFHVSVTNDAAVEATSETINLALSNPVNATLGGTSSAVLSIVDDDLPGVSFSSATYSVAENVASGTATITVVLSGTSPQTITVDYATSDGTAAGIDYGSASGTLTFLSGETSQAFAVSINDDSFVELDETVNLILSDPVNATLGGTSTAALTIVSEDETTVYLATDSYGVAEDGNSVDIAVMLSPTGHPGTVSVHYTTSDGTAEEDSDYAVASGTLTFSPDDFMESFSVTVNDDTAAEANEILSLTLSNPVNAVLGGTNTATVTIIDNDTPNLAFSSSTYSVAENVASGTATITVVLSGTSTQTITVNYTTSDSTATAGSDYTAASGTLTFAAGDTRKTVTVSVTDDALAENAIETVVLSLSNPVNAVLGGTATAILTITDNDAPDINFSSLSYSVTEGSPTAIATVTLSGSSTGTITVNYATSNGTAIAGTDYTSASGTLSFVAGDLSQTFSVPIIDDDILESDETVALSLSNPVNAILGGNSAATLTITSEDVPEVVFTSATYTVAENVASGTVTITVVLSGTPVSQATVNYSTSDGTAAVGTDFMAASGTLTFAVGDTSESFAISINDDGETEGNETLDLTLSNPSNLTLGSVDAATVTITDNDLSAPTVSTSAASSVGETSAVLNGILSDMGGTTSTTVSFEWGTTTAYGNTIAVGARNSTGNFSVNLSGLNSGTIYYFRAKAVNEAGSGNGSGLSFTTSSPSPSGGGGGGGGGGAMPIITPPVQSTGNVIPEPAATPAPISRPPAPILQIPAIETTEVVTVDLTINIDGKVAETVITTSDDGGCTLVVPEGTRGLNEDGNPLEVLTMEQTEISPDMAEGTNIVCTVYDFGPDGAIFDPPISVKFTYDESLIPSDKDERDLVVAVWDENSNTWIELASTIDPATNSIVAEISHFSVYTVLVSKDIAEPHVVEETEIPSAEKAVSETEEIVSVTWAVLGIIIGVALLLIAVTTSVLVIRQRRYAGMSD